MKEAKPGTPIVTDEVNQLSTSILASVNMAEVVFALAKKGPKSPEEKKQADDMKTLNDAFICAKATQIRRIVAGSVFFVNSKLCHFYALSTMYSKKPNIRRRQG